MDIYLKIIEYMPYVFAMAFFYFVACWMSSFDKEQVKDSYKRGGIIYLVFIVKWSRLTKKYIILALLSFILFAAFEVYYRYSKP